MPIPLTFPGGSGNRLTGMVSLPGNRTRADWPAVAILLCTAINPRWAGRALTREIIALLNGAGIPLLSFDFPGVGDSEGELRETSLIDIYHLIETGCFVPDTLAAIRFARMRFPARRTILIGRCGGAITALHAAAYDPTVTQLVLFELPVSLSTPPGVVALDHDTAQYRLGTYLGKLRNLRKLPRRLFRTENWGNTWSALSSLRKREGEIPGLTRGLNAAFLASFFEVKRHGTDTLCLFGEESGLYELYDGLFRARYALPSGEPAPHWTTRTSLTGGHDFSAPEARRETLGFIDAAFRQWGILEEEALPELFRAVLP